MLEDMFDDSYRISLSEDTSQSALYYPHNTMSIHTAAYTFSTQTKMNENIPSLDSALYMVAKAQYKQKTSNCIDTSQHQDLAKGFKVSTPGGAQPGTTHIRSAELYHVQFSTPAVWPKLLNLIAATKVIVVL